MIVDEDEYLKDKFAHVGTCSFGDILDFIPPVEDNGN